jgi:hypothetical protein
MITGLRGRTVRVQAPGPKDGIPEGTRQSGGFPGPHAGVGEFIAALRGRIAVLEFKARPGRGRKLPGREI